MNSALASIALFPILQWVFRNDPTKREAIPQLVFSIEGNFFLNCTETV